jgi:FAD/FMN-containing dehydrogenase
MQSFIDAQGIDTFRKGFHGAVVTPDAAAYDDSRKAYNGAVDRRPAVIAYCNDPEDVARAIDLARASGAPLAVRCGGHSDYSVCDGGVVIDVSPMGEVEIDEGARIARVGAGLKNGELDAATHLVGLATPAGTCSTVGIAGAGLGGGLGWLSRKYGLACDNILRAEVVTADGRLVTASEDLNPDLFWGLRGAGHNFGVATSFEFQLHPVTTVIGGFVAYHGAVSGDYLRFLREFAASAPDELSMFVLLTSIPPLPEVPSELHGRPAFVMAVCYVGPGDEGLAVVRPLREFGGALMDTIGPMPYPVLQTLFDPMAPWGLGNDWRFDYADELSDAVIDTLLAYMEKVPSPLDEIHIRPLGGAIARVPEDATAFPGRSAAYGLNTIVRWDNPADAARHIEWELSLEATMAPFTTGQAYLNLTGAVSQERVERAYGEAKYRRLQALKDEYDPTNLFRMNHNIRPSGA